MASQKISQLPSAITTSNGDLYPIVQGGANLSVTFTKLQAAILAGIASGNLTDSTSGADGISITNGTGVVLGSGTQIAQAAASATQNGYLKSVDWSTFNNKQPPGNYTSRLVFFITGNTIAAAAPFTDYVYLASSLAPITVTLPTAVGNDNLYTVKNVGAHLVTVATTGGQTIDGSATAPIPVSYTSLSFVSDGSDWNIV